LSDADLSALHSALAALAGWGVVGAAVLYEGSRVAISAAIEAGRTVAVVLAAIDYGPLVDAGRGAAALAVAAADVAHEYAIAFGQIMAPALVAARDAGEVVGDEALSACVRLAAFATPLAEDAARGISAAMGAAVQHIADTDLEPLQRAACLCAAAGVAGFELVATSLNEACLAAAAAGREVVIVALQVIQEVPWSDMSSACASAAASAEAAALSAAKTGGALLLVGLQKAAAAGEDVGEAAIAGATEMAEHGTVLAGAAAQEIAAKMGPILANLGDAACEALQKSVALAAHAGKEGAMLLWQAAGPAVKEAIALGREFAPYALYVQYYTRLIVSCRGGIKIRIPSHSLPSPLPLLFHFRYALVPLLLPAIAAYFAYKGAAWLANEAYGVLSKLPYDEMAGVAKVIADAAGKAAVEAAKQSGAVLGEGATIVAKVFVNIAGDAADAAGDAAGAALDAASQFYESGMVQNALGDAVDGAEEIFQFSRDELKNLYSVLKGISVGGCFAMIDQNHIHILIDYMQLLGLYISQLAGSAWAWLAPVFGTIYNFFAVDFGAIVKGIAGVVGEGIMENIELIAIIAAVATICIIIAVSSLLLLCFCCMACRNARSESDDINRGHEKMESWSELAAKNKRWVRVAFFFLLPRRADRFHFATHHLLLSLILFSAAESAK
jgi:hypothetical protein